MPLYSLGTIVRHEPNRNNRAVNFRRAMQHTVRDSCVLILIALNVLLVGGYDGYFQSLQFGRQVKGNPLRVLWDLSLYDCYLACRHRPRCVSFNYQRPGARCTLNEDGDSTETLILKSGSVYSRKDRWTEDIPSYCKTCSANQTCHPESDVSCSVEECGQPEPPVDRLLVSNGNVWGTNGNVRYTCPSGYKYIGTSHVTTCLATGSWSVLDAQCVPIVPVVCPSDWLLHDNSCYHFNSTSSTWDDAQTYCQTFNAHLVYVDSQMKADFLRSTIQAKEAGAVSGNYWTGANDREVEGQYMWGYPNGTRVDFTDWAENEPNDGGKGENCALMRRRLDFKWIDVLCSKENLFICEIP